MEFKKKSLTEAENYYKQLHLTSDQRRKVRLVAKLATQYIPISEHAMCGFAFRALQEYQIENKIELTEFESMSNEATLKMINDAMNRVKNQLLKILIDKKQEPVLDDAIVKLLDFYKKNLL
ncbi:MAG: hypothetical protein ACFFBP_03980 [Promethearchaeota archaeon]